MLKFETEFLKYAWGEYTIALILIATLHRRQNPVRIVGAPVSMRVHKVGGAIKNSRPVFVSQSRTPLCVQSGCANYRKFNGRPSLRIPPGSFATEYHVYVYYYTADWRQCMGIPPYCSISYPSFEGALPPQIK